MVWVSLRGLAVGRHNGSGSQLAEMTISSIELPVWGQPVFVPWLDQGILSSNRGTPVVSKTRPRVMSPKVL